jgi:hypothetical protein
VPQSGSLRHAASASDRLPMVGVIEERGSLSTGVLQVQRNSNVALKKDTLTVLI